MGIKLVRNNGYPDVSSFNAANSPALFEIVGGKAHAAGCGYDAGVRALQIVDGPGCITGHTYHWVISCVVVSGSFQLWSHMAPNRFGPVLGPGSHKIHVEITSAVDNLFCAMLLVSNSADSEVYVSYLQVEDITMALVDNGFKLYVSLVDAGGDQSTISFDLVAATHADALTAAGTILTRLAAVTDAEVKSYTINNVYIEDALSLPTSGQVEERAKVVAQIDGQPLKKATIYIPAPADAIFSAAAGNPGFNRVDVLDAALDAYVDIWKATGALATISDGENLADQEALSGVRTHRQSSFG